MKMVRNFKSLIIVASIVVFMLVAYYISAVFFEPKAYNFMVENFSTVRHGSNEIVLVVIDDKSLNRIRWPWKRELYAKIFEYLNTYSMAKVIGFDARIATPDIEHPNSDAKFYNSVKNIDNLVVGFVTLSTTYHDIEAGKRYDEAFDKKFSINVEDKRKKKYSSYYNSISKFPWGYF